MGELGAPKVNSGPYSQFTINTETQCQQGVITPFSCENANFLLFISASFFYMLEHVSLQTHAHSHHWIIVGPQPSWFGFII